MVSLTATSSAPMSMSAADSLDDAFHGTCPSATERRRKIGTDREALRVGRRGQLRVVPHRVGNRLVDVALAERLGGGREHGDVIEPALDGGLESTSIWHQRRKADARAPRGRPRDLTRIGHLRDPLRADERGDLDHRQAGSGELIDELQLQRRVDGGVLFLQAVARADLDDFHAARQRRAAHDSSTSVTPGWTSSPGAQRISATRPALGARSVSSIFMASSTTSVSPCHFVAHLHEHGVYGGGHRRGQQGEVAAGRATREVLEE
jgi:hypothetical protein